MFNDFILHMRTRVVFSKGSSRKNRWLANRISRQRRRIGYVICKAITNLYSPKIL